MRSTPSRIKEGEFNSSTSDQRRLLKRMVVVCVVLMLEYFAFSLAFDIGSLATNKNNPLHFLGYMGTLAPLVMMIATASILLVGTSLRSELIQIAAKTSYKKSLPLWAGHLMSYVFLVGITPGIFSSTGLLAAWLLAAVAAVGSALLLAMPFHFWVTFVRRSYKYLLVGCVVGTLAWGAGLFSESLWSSLGAVTFQAVKHLVNFLPGEKVVDDAANIVGTTQFSVVVAPVCSGYQGIGLMLVFVSSYLFFKRKLLRFPTAFLLLPVSIFLVWLANTFRIFILIALGVAGHERIAIGGFHAKAGWIMFCILALGIVAAAQSVSGFTKVPPSKKTRDTWNPTAVYLLPFLSAVAVSMVTGLFSATSWDPAYPLRILVAIGVLWGYRTYFVSQKFSFAWLPIFAGVGTAAGWIAFDEYWGNADSVSTSSPVAAVPSAILVIWIVFRVLGSGIVIPIIEEIAFRGYLSRRLVRVEFTDVSYKQFTWLSFLVSSIAFGMMHGDRWMAGVAAGMIFAGVVYYRGKLTDSIVAHGVANILIAVYVLTFDRWSLWM